MSCAAVATLPFGASTLLDRSTMGPVSGELRSDFVEMLDRMVGRTGRGLLIPANTRLRLVILALRR